MSHPLFTPEARYLLAENDVAGMETFLETLHPATVAETIASDAFTPEEFWRFLQHTSIMNQATIFAYLPIEQQATLVEGAGRPQMARLIEKMSHDDRVDLLRRLPQPVVESLLRLVDEADRRDIATLVRYPENTAGALMTTDYAWLPANITASDAIERLRLQAPNSETIYYVYVLDDQRHVLGVVSLRDLILAPRPALVRDLMETEIVKARATDDREKVAQDIARYDLLAVPVVDEDNRLVGIVTYDDVIDVVVQEATEDVYRMGAVGPIGESYLKADFVKVWRTRAFWMACFFVAEMGTIRALGHFEEGIQRLVVLSLFIPLCISTGGNSGGQAATLITRALALGQVNVRDWLRVLRHELVMGLALGLTLGFLGFWGASLLAGSSGEQANRWVLAWVIAQTVTAICLWGTVVGSMLPLAFQTFGIDPGIASSPFVATFVDVTGIFIYFSIASIYLL